ncbi:hypothetical protein [Pseudoduganella violaceinigra]|uniref:hypothetical protein n=1 Tax=Pseudoduganella violaceinigra TaxID=246602 RepID=UPI0012B64C0D|nr:hypothetical protein [Pseudoduganella violaceinigra]
MSVLMTSVPVAQVRKWGGAYASGALSFAAARVARIVLQREPMASEALSWTTLYSCQGEAVRGRAELALHLLARPELAELDAKERLRRAYNAVFDRYDASQPADMAYWLSQMTAGRELAALVRHELVPLFESGYRSSPCASPATARSPLFVVRDGSGLPLVFTLGSNRSLYLFRRTPFGRWSQTDLSGMLPLNQPGKVQALDVQQAPDGTIALALAVAPWASGGGPTLHVAVGISNQLDETGWVEVMRGMAARHVPEVEEPVTRIAFGLLQSGAVPMVLVTAENTWYFNAAAEGALIAWDDEGAEPSLATALGSYRVPGAWRLSETPSGRMLRFNSFARAAAWGIAIDYQGLPRRANGLHLAPSNVPNVPDVFVAGDSIVVYRGGQSVPQPVANIGGACVVWSEATAVGEYLAYGDGAGGLWLVCRRQGGHWSMPVPIATTLVMAALMAAPNHGGVHAIGITPGGALAWLRFNADGAQVGAEEITQAAVWDDEAQDVQRAARVTRSVA